MALGKREKDQRGERREKGLLYYYYYFPLGWIVGLKFNKEERERDGYIG